MMLPEISLPSRVNQRCDFSGIDSVEYCPNLEHFHSYPHQIEYQYNSRGFRDNEWPGNQSALRQAIWCLGDSFTVGIGSPRHHTWPATLQEVTKKRTINVSMDGASNNWIARQATSILETIQPDFLILHWSYLHRREGLNSLDKNARYGFFIHYENVRGPDWPNISCIEQFSELPVHIQNELLHDHDQSWRQSLNDDQLRLWHIKSDIQQDIANTQQCIDLVEKIATKSVLIHSFIPGSVIGFEDELHAKIKTRFPLIQQFDCLDLARDGHHYDLKTSQYFVDLILQEMNRWESI